MLKKNTKMGIELKISSLHFQLTFLKVLTQMLPDLQFDCFETVGKLSF